MYPESNTAIIEEKDPNIPYYVYLLIDPITDEPVYVGQSPDVIRRIGQHLGNTHNNESLIRFINKLRDNFLLPKFKVLEKCTSYNIDKREEFWIKHYAELNNNLFNRAGNPYWNRRQKCHVRDAYYSSVEESMEKLNEGINSFKDHR